VEHGSYNHPKKYAMDYATKIIGYWLPRKILQSSFTLSSMKGVIAFPVILFL
jgi:hypothetical protein